MLYAFSAFAYLHGFCTDCPECSNDSVVAAVCRHYRSYWCPPCWRASTPDKKGEPARPEMPNSRSGQHGVYCLHGVYTSDREYSLHGPLICLRDLAVNLRSSCVTMRLCVGSAVSSSIVSVNALCITAPTLLYAA